MDAEIAYVARYYSPVGSGRTSNYALYVSRLDGSRRKRIGRADGDDSVAWLDNRTLAIAREKGGVDFVTPTGRLIKRVAKGPNMFYGVDRLQGFQNETGQGFSRLGLNGLTPVARPWWLPQTVNQGESVVVVENGRSVTYPTPLYEGSTAMMGRVVRYRDANYFFGGSYGASGGDYVAIWRLGTTPARLMSDTLSDTRIEFTRGMYLGLSPGRELSDYGRTGRRVWTSHLYVGKLGQTKARQITRGLVYVSSAALRPLP